jgi:hypothetical protein
MTEKSLAITRELQLSACLEENSIDAVLDLFILLDEWDRSADTSALEKLVGPSGRFSNFRARSRQSLSL